MLYLSALCMYVYYMPYSHRVVLKNSWYKQEKVYFIPQFHCISILDIISWFSLTLPTKIISRCGWSEHFLTLSFAASSNSFSFITPHCSLCSLTDLLKLIRLLFFASLALLRQLNSSSLLSLVMYPDCTYCNHNIHALIDTQPTEWVYH